MKSPFRFNKFTGSFLALGLILWDTKGMFFSGIPIGLIGITILFLYWIKTVYVGSAITVSAPYPARAIFFLVIIQAIILFSGLFYEPYDLLHSDSINEHTGLLQGAIILFGIAACVLTYQYYRGKDMARTLIILIGIAVAIQILTVFCSVLAGIDVVVMMQKACRFLTQGKNPYDARYPDMFHGRYLKYYGPVNYMTYWPFAVYIGSIFYYLLGDYRYAYVLVNVTLVLLLYRNRSSAGLDKQNALLFGLLWISNPVLSFNINRGWIDIFATLPCFLFLYYLDKRRLILSAVFLGLVVSVKLYYFLMTPLALIYVIHHFGVKKSISFVFVCGGVFLATILPFLIIDHMQFYQSTIGFYSAIKIARPDSLSWVSYLTRLDLQLITEGTIFSLVCILLFCIWFMRTRKTLVQLIEFSSLVLFIFFLCGRQAFCNYYLFILFLYYLAVFFSVKTDHTTQEKLV